MLRTEVVGEDSIYSSSRTDCCQKTGVRVPFLASRGYTDPKYWGAWFSPLNDCSMKETDLNVFVQLGAALEDLRELSVEMGVGDAILQVHRPAQWLTAFVLETEAVPMPEARKYAKELGRLLHAFLIPPTYSERKLTQDELVNIIRCRDLFLKELEREHRNINVFTVLPKGIYNTQALIENPELKFPETIRKHFTDQMLY